jgi:predicted nucleic acid-binding protein
MQSVLVPVFYGDHERHDSCVAAFKRYDKKQAACGAHSLAEVYGSLTRMPGRHRISSERALLFVATLRERFTIVALTEEEYFQCIEANAALGVVGGTIYDALLAHCALKAKAEAMYWWNIRHYQFLGPGVAKRLRTP